MRTRVFSLIFAVFAVGCLAAPQGAFAARGGDRPSLDRILPQIREQHPGTFYDADGPFMGADGRQHYRVKWKTPQGRVIWFDADAQTGRVFDGNGYRRDRDFDRPRDLDQEDRIRRKRDRFGPGPEDNWDRPGWPGRRGSFGRPGNPGGHRGHGQNN